MGIKRRTFLYSLAGFSLSFCPLRALAAQEPSLPVLMFHKVNDVPRYPEDISPSQLEEVFTFLWQQGFYPVSISDILDNAIDSVVPRGLKPIAITADDAHPSIFFPTTHLPQKNTRSFMAVLLSSLAPFGFPARATFFLSEIADDRYSKEPGGYFAKRQTLPEIVEYLADYPGIEFGYHTIQHKNMKAMGAREVAATLKAQMDSFKQLGVLQAIEPVLAYPFGVQPSQSGMQQLRSMFKGAVLAFPGIQEAAYQSLPTCQYNGKLLTDPFLIPRVCVGAYTYTYKHSALEGDYQPISPLDDLKKDMFAPANGLFYISRGV